MLSLLLLLPLFAKLTRFRTEVLNLMPMGMPMNGPLAYAERFS